MRLYSERGERLYVNRSERLQFKRIADKQTPSIRFFCLILLYTGCRISEARALRLMDIQSAEGIVSINTLKKRHRHHVREVPVPPQFLETLQAHFANQHKQSQLWPQSRTTAWRNIKAVMSEARITGTHASAKGLRHSFAMNCAFEGIPITLCQTWMGHSSVTTTAIYYRMAGRDALEMAKRLW